MVLPRNLPHSSQVSCQTLTSLLISTLTPFPQLLRYLGIQALPSAQ